MKIIIVGCGKVGYTLVEKLENEDHNLVVIDVKEDKVRQITSNLDAMGVVGNGVSYEVLQEAGIVDADLLIAVTGSDEQNLLCCLIAKKAGSCKAIARVRNPVYSNEVEYIQEELGLAMSFNPEQIAAAEIARNFQFPAATKIDSFAKGRIEMLHFRVGEGCKLKNVRLMDIKSTFKCEVLVCMVNRNEEVIIPRGDFVFREEDAVAFVATPSRANEFFAKIGIRVDKVHTAMIVGGGKISYYLAKRLLEGGIDTRIVEMDLARCEHLSDLLPKATIIHGDGTDQSLIMQEGLDQVDGFVALTDLDEENILLSLYAKKVSKAKVITKVNRITFSSVINDLKMDSIIYPRLLTADRILKYARSMNESMNSNMENLYKLEDGRAEAVEFKIKEESAVTGISLEKLKIRKDILVCGIMRGSRVIVPSGRDTLMVGDSVVLVLTGDRLHDIEDILED